MSLIIFMDELDFLSSFVTRHPGRSLSPTSDYVLKILSKSQGVFNIIARSFGRGKKIISFQSELSNLRAMDVVPDLPGEQQKFQAIYLLLRTEQFG